MKQASRYRKCVAGIGCGVIALGLVSRVLPLGLAIWDEYLGDALYAALAFLALAFVWPHRRTAAHAAAAISFVTAVELFQLTPIPAALNRSDVLLVRLFAYLVLGSTFSWWDLLAYAVGILVIAGVDLQLRRFHR
jgi:hypothetical protein